MIERILKLDPILEDSIFLWGPRKTGKSTLLRNLYPQAFWIDLLKTDLVLEYTKNPALLRERVSASLPELVVIDEIQKVPQLLDEVHLLIERYKTNFVLCGSSARKVKKSHANLLGGRALRYELFGLSAKEIGEGFDLDKMLNNGYIPSHYLRDNPSRLIRSYINTYLKEEILDEGLSRSLPIFSDFLRSAAYSDGETLNYTNIASDTGRSSTTVKEYFLILSDTLLGRWLPAFTRRAKRKVIHSPKFYFADIAVVNHLIGRKEVNPGSLDYGKAFENWVFHELSLFNEYSELFFDLRYWKLTTEKEVDFILGDGEVAIEAKSANKISNRHLKNLREFKKDHPSVKKLIVVCKETLPRKTDDNILILPYKSFIEMLWAKEIIS